VSRAADACFRRRYRCHAVAEVLGTVSSPEIFACMFAQVSRRRSPQERGYAIYASSVKRQSARRENERTGGASEEKRGGGGAEKGAERRSRGAQPRSAFLRAEHSRSLAAPGAGCGQRTKRLAPIPRASAVRCPRRAEPPRSSRRCGCCLRGSTRPKPQRVCLASPPFVPAACVQRPPRSAFAADARKRLRNMPRQRLRGITDGACPASSR